MYIYVTLYMYIHNSYISIYIYSMLKHSFGAHHHHVQSIFHAARVGLNKKSQQLNLQAKPAVDNSTQRVKTEPKMPYVDYLSLQAKVSKGSFAFFLRQNNANPKTMGYLLSHIHQRIRNRPDTLESILFDAEAQKLRDSRLIGFIVNEIKARTVA